MRRVCVLPMTRQRGRSSRAPRHIIDRLKRKKPAEEGGLERILSVFRHLLAIRRKALRGFHFMVEEATANNYCG